MTKEEKSNMESKNFNTSSDESKIPSKKEPWKKKFVEEDTVKAGQFSRTARNQPAREATTISKVLLFLIIFTCLIPFVLYLWVSSTRGKQVEPPRTASQVSISRASTSSLTSESSSESKTESTTSEGSLNITTNSVNSSEENASSRSERPVRQSSADPVRTPAPEPTPAPQTGGTYTVQAGDSWYGIATKLGVDVYTLAAVNGATIESTILPGQVIVTP